MEKFLKWLYYICLSVLVIGVSYVSVMMFISPRQDAAKRGFIPCTERLVYDISSCSAGELSCPLGFLWQDMRCNVKVVWSGLIDWTKGQQAAPWSNYLFEPIAEAEIDEELPYQGNVLRDMNDMEALRIFAEKKQAELEEAKNRQLNLNENVIMGSSDSEIPYDDLQEMEKAEKDITDVEAGNILDEAFNEEKWPDNTEKSEQPRENDRDVLQYINQKTAEHLNSKEEDDAK